MRTGNVSQLPSGRWSVRVSLPGGQRRRCRETFDTAVRAGDEDGADAAAVALASDVLATEARLAASVLADGPTALRDALTLADLLSPPSVAGGARGVG